MKKLFSSLFRPVVQWFQFSARRAQAKERISPEQLREALREALADPQTRTLILRDLVGKVFAIEGAQVVCKPANEISAGAFGASCGGATCIAFPPPWALGY